MFRRGQPVNVDVKMQKDANLFKIVLKMRKRVFYPEV